MTAKIEKANIVSEIALEGVDRIHGVSFDGRWLWFADGTRGGLCAVDPTSKSVSRRIDVEAKAGTAFDGTHLYQVGSSPESPGSTASFGTERSRAREARWSPS
jgi:hypothetical protein